MKVVSSEGLTKLIQLIKNTFVDKTNLASVATSGSYNDLSNKPTIPTVNNATLTIQKNGTTVNTFTANASSNVTANISVPTKTSDLTNDSGYTTNTGTVTSVNNVNPVNGNVTISIPTVDQSYSGTSTNAQSGVAVKSAIDSAISSVYKAAGSVAYASLPTPAASNEGYVYNITNAFTTDSRFVEGSGKTYPAGTNVVIINTGSSTYKFDVLTGMVDLSGYVPTTRTVNGKALSSNISLTASDVSALPSSTIIPTISDTYSATSSNGMSGKAVASAISTKQDAISDLATIRSGAAAGATALQQSDIASTYSATGTAPVNGKAVASAISGKANSSDLATVATSGSYNDLSNKPTIPTVNNATLTIQKNGTTVNTFTANASSNVTANITVPTNTNELTNGAGFITSASLPGVATTSTAGLVKPDGTTITVDANGTISSASSVDIDEETITKNSDNELQVVAVKNKRDDSTLGIWHGTEYQWNHGDQITWYYWQTSVTATLTSGGTLPVTNQYQAVAAYGDGTFVIAIQYTQSVYSIDNGVTWNTNNMPSSRWGCIAFGNGVFVAGVQYGKSTWYSTDKGVTWQQGGDLPESIRSESSTFGDGVFICIGSDNSYAYISNDNGQTWQKGGEIGSSKVGIAYGNGVFVVVGNNDIRYSTDKGVTWHQSTIPANINYYTVTYGNNKFVAVGSSDNGIVYSEDNGQTWTRISAVSNLYPRIAYGNGVFVIIGYFNSTMYYSTDLLNWSTAQFPDSNKRDNIAYGNEKFVSIGLSSSNAPSAIFSVIYDKCYTDTTNPTATSVVYSAPETVSSYTIASVTSGAITLSNNNTYYYNQSGNAFTYRTIGDAHPEYLAFIDGVGIKKGNTLIASATPITTTITSTSTDTEAPSAKAVYDEIGEVESALNTINSGS